MKVDKNSYQTSLLQLADFKITYSTADNKVEIVFDHRIVKGDYLYSDRMSFDASYIEPLRELLEKLEEDIKK